MGRRKELILPSPWRMEPSNSDDPPTYSNSETGEKLSFEEAKKWMDERKQSMEFVKAEEQHNDAKKRRKKKKAAKAVVKPLQWPATEEQISGDEPMEVEMDIQGLRRQNADVYMREIDVPSSSQSLESTMIIVLDTCSVINSLARRLIDESIRAGIGIRIPYTVLIELDIFKDFGDQHRRSRAQRGNRTVLEAFERFPHLVSLESSADRSQPIQFLSSHNELQDFPVRTPDEKILKTALMAKQRAGSEVEVILVTEDVNLRLKAASHGVTASKAEDFIRDYLSNISAASLPRHIPAEIRNQPGTRLPTPPPAQTYGYVPKRYQQPRPSTRQYRPYPPPLPIKESPSPPIPAPQPVVHSPAFPPSFQSLQQMWQSLVLWDPRQLIQTPQFPQHSPRPLEPRQIPQTTPSPPVPLRSLHVLPQQHLVPRAPHHFHQSPSPPVPLHAVQFPQQTPHSTAPPRPLPSQPALQPRQLQAPAPGGYRYPLPAPILSRPKTVERCYSYNQTVMVSGGPPIQRPQDSRPRRVPDSFPKIEPSMYGFSMDDDDDAMEM